MHAVRTPSPIAPTVIAAIAASCIGVVIALALALGALDAAHAKFFPVASNSMVPSFQRGDLVITRAAQTLHVGDTVTFRKYGTLVTHRIVANGKTPGTFETRGDANPGNDPWTITPADVVGTVRSTVTNAGFPLLMLEDPRGRALAGNGLAALIIALWWALPRAMRAPSALAS